MGEGPFERLAPEDRAAIAAVDGLGSLSPLDADAVDPDEVARYEAAAGALFTAFSLERRADQGPPAGLQDRLERAADLYVGSRFAEGESTSNRTRAMGAADADSSTRDHSTFAEVRAQGRPAETPSRSTSHPDAGSGFSLLPALAGWAAAAALLVGMLTATRRISELESGTADVQPPATLMTQLQMEAPDAVSLAWAPLDPANRLGGKVIWSDGRNEGYMQIKGLPVNDPSKSQYQLWIFRGDDPGAEPHPVDGGVFDITEAGEVVIPISAKLAVGRAGIFAVTVEKPGGVVVSEREQIVALAQRTV